MQMSDLPIIYNQDLNNLPFRLPQGRILLDYWQSVRNGEEIPKANDFDPMAIFKLLPDIMILDLPNDDMVRYRLAGTATVERLGYEPRGRNVLDLTAGKWRQSLFDIFNLVARRHVGLLAHYTNEYEDGFLAHIESVVLPLIPPDDQPPRVVMIVNSKEFEFTNSRTLTAFLHELEKICIFDLGFGLPAAAA